MDKYWESPHNDLTDTQRKSVQALREVLRNCELNVARALADSAIDKLRCSKADMQLLWRYIQADSPSNATARSRLLIVQKIVLFLNREHNLQLPLPAIPSILTRPNNPHRDIPDGVIWAGRCYRALCEMESRWLAGEEDAPTLELILCSGVLHGGLFHFSVLVCAGATLVSPAGKLGHIGGAPYVELNLPWRGKPDMERRLWFPDRQTASLIGRSPDCGRRVPAAQNDAWRAVAAEKFEETIWRSMRKMMRKFKLPAECLPKTLKQFVDLVALAATQEFPPIVISYGARKFVCYSLKPESLDRLRGFQLTNHLDDQNLGAGIDLSEKKTPRASDLTVSDSSPEEPLPNVFAPLRAVFRSKDEGDVLHNLEELVKSVGESATAATRIAQFALYLLTERHQRPSVRRRQKPTLQTVREYTYSLIRRFGCLLDGGSADPVGLPTDDLEAKCTEAIEATYTRRNPQVAKNELAHLLNEFFDFLEHKFGVEPISREIIGGGGGLVPVDATIIRVEDYYESRRYVREELRGDHPEALLRAVEAQIVLEYRCGARRMEGIGLEEGDIVDSGQEWIFIRPNAIRGVKTLRSLRQAPLYAECSDEELAVIKRWKDDLASGIRYTQHVIMPILLDALGFATGMSRPRAHQYRHGWVSLTSMKLMLAELDHIPELFPDSPMTMEELRKGAELRRALLGHSSDVPVADGRPALRAPTRKHAYAVTSMAGHALTETTAEHYLHIMCVLLKCFLEQSSVFGVTTRKFALAAGCSERTAYSEAASSIPLKLWHKAFGKLIGDEPPLESGGAPTGAAGRRPFWRPAENLLIDCQESVGTEIKDLAEKNGLSPERAEFYVENSFRIGAIREARGMQTPRHPLSPLPDDERILPYVHLVPRPVRPMATKDAQVIKALQHPLEDAFKANEVLGRAVLGYFVHNAWLTEENLLFRSPMNPAPAREHLQFLKLCGLDASQIRIVSFDTTDDARWKRRWAASLQVVPDNIVMGGVAPFSPSGASSKWLSIEPNLSRDPVPANRSVPGASGFRFLLTMAATIFGFDTP